MSSAFQPAVYDVTRIELSHFLTLVQSWMQINLATWHRQDKHLYRHRSDGCCRKHRLFFRCRVCFPYIFIPDCSRLPADSTIYFHIFLMRISNIQNNYWHFLFYSFFAFSVLFSYYYSLVFLYCQAGNVGHNNSSFCRPMRDRAASDTEWKRVEEGGGIKRVKTWWRGKRKKDAG